MSDLPNGVLTDSTTRLTLNSTNTPSSDLEGDCFIQESPTAVDEKVSVSTSISKQSSFRKTVVSVVLLPLKAAKLMVCGQNPRPPGEISLEESLRAPPAIVESPPLDESMDPIDPACVDDDEAIEVALDVDNATVGDNPCAASVPKTIRMDLKSIIDPTTGKLVKDAHGAKALWFLDLLRKCCEKGDWGRAHAIEIETGKDCQDIKFCQVFESENSEAFEMNAVIFGWLDTILESSVRSNDPTEAAQYLVSYLARKYPQAFGATAEEFGFMKVVGMEM